MNAIKVCKQLINDLIQEGYKFQVAKQDLEKVIMYRRGIDERTVDRWIKALVTFGFLKFVNCNIYEFNPLMIPELMKVLKEKPQTKMM